MAKLPQQLLDQVYSRFQQYNKKTKSSRKKNVISAVRLKTMVDNTIDKPQDALEKIRGGNNLTSISFLLRGYEVGQSVGCIWDKTKEKDNNVIGTGFLIAPTILLTNNHVISSKEEAENMVLRMNYQRDLDGQIEPYCDFNLAPSTCFVTNEKLDFTIVAVQEKEIGGKIKLSDFGYLQLFEQAGKISEGEFCTIIQHPDGRPKQIAMFENEVISMANPDFMLYKTDTVGGSSGSPVLNYDWVVVGLHHAGVPTAKAARELKSNKTKSVDEHGFDRDGNEGVRISSILRQLKIENIHCYHEIIAASKVRLEKSLPIHPYKYARNGITNSNFESIGAAHIQNNNTVDPNLISINPNHMTNSNNKIKINIPLEISLGDISDQFDSSVVSNAELEKRKNKTTSEATSHIENRDGFNPKFLGKLTIDLSKLYAPFKKKSLVAGLLNDAGDELKYEHFSVVTYKKRKMCIMAAVNIDGRKKIDIKRENDKWFFDSRLSMDSQIGNELYSNNDLDRGHMVRRQDPVWGNSAEQANEDSFHYTNACPQHKNLNQKTWLSLEDYVLKNTNTHDLKVSVISGPILDENYVHYREALVPVQFYKIVAMIKKNGRPSVTGYVLSQKELISGLERVQTEFVFGKFKTYQLSLAQIEDLTGLDLKTLKPFDPLKNQLEAIPLEIEDMQDVVL